MDRILHPLLIGMCFLGSFPLHVSAGDTDELIRRVTEAYQSEWDRKVAMEIDVEWVDTGTIDSPEPLGWARRQHWVHHRDGERVEWILDKMDYIDPQGKVYPRTRETDWHIYSDGTRYLSAEVLHGKSPWRDTWVSEKRVYWVTTTAQKCRRRTESELCNSQFGYFLDGKLGAIGDLASWISASDDVRLQPEPVQIDGVLCRVLEVRTPSGLLTAWVSPERGYKALKWQLRAGPDDLHRDGQSLKTLGMVESVTTVDSVRLETIDGHVVPVAGTMTNEARFMDGTHATTRYKVERSHIDLDPDFEALGAFKPKIPNGTRVVDLDFPGIAYMWRDGRIVQRIDDETVAQITREMRKERQQREGVLLDHTSSDLELPLAGPVADAKSAEHDTRGVGAPAQTTWRTSTWLVPTVIGVLVLLGWLGWAVRRGWTRAASAGSGDT